MTDDFTISTPQTNLRYASFQHRLGAIVLDATLIVLTLGIGWVIWSFIVWGQGQTPGKQILKLRVYDKTTEKPAKWGQMAIREFLLPLTVTVALLPFIVAASISIPDQNTQILAMGLVYIAGFAVQLVDAFWILKGSDRNRLVDKFAKTDVLNEAPKA